MSVYRVRPNPHGPFRYKHHVHTKKWNRCVDAVSEHLGKEAAYRICTKSLGKDSFLPKRPNPSESEFHSLKEIEMEERESPHERREMKLIELMKKHLNHVIDHDKISSDATQRLEHLLQIVDELEQMHK